MILKGYVNEITQGGRFAKVITFENEVIDNVLMIHPYGESNFMQSDGSSLVILFLIMGSKDNVVGIPYNVLLEPILEETEKSVGNYKVGNKVVFTKDGNIEITGTNDFLAQTLVNATISATTKISIDAPNIGLGDETGLVLNDTASMQVTIPSGSSAGTYNVTVVNAGQTKVTA